MISVIIPAYNAGQCLGRAIESVLAQSFSDYEIIVIDDGSTDNTAEVAKSYGDRVNYIYQDNAGPGTARNRGLDAAKGDWIAFLDADDQWLPKKLELQMELLARNPHLQWCGCNFSQALGGRRKAVFNPDDVQKVLGDKEYFENYFTDCIKGHHLTAIITSTITLVVARKVFDEVGFFNTELLRQQDFDMWIRIAFRFPQCGHIAEPLAVAHLEIANPVMIKRRLDLKRGVIYRETMPKYLKMAQEYNCVAEFRPFAFVIMRDVLLITLFHGLKQDALETVRSFPQLFGWHWRIAARILTVFPRFTSTVAQNLAYLAGRLNLDRQVSRRWIHLKKTKENADE